MRLLHRLRQDVAQRELKVRSVILKPTVSKHRYHRADSVFPNLSFRLDGAVERAELREAAAFAHPELHAPVADQIKRGDPFRNTGVMIDRQLNDTVAEAGILRPLVGRAEENFGRRAMRILL